MPTSLAEDLGNFSIEKGVIDEFSLFLCFEKKTQHTASWLVHITLHFEHQEKKRNHNNPFLKISCSHSWMFELFMFDLRVT